MEFNDGVLEEPLALTAREIVDSVPSECFRNSNSVTAATDEAHCSFKFRPPKVLPFTLAHVASALGAVDYRRRQSSIKSHRLVFCSRVSR